MTEDGLNQLLTRTRTRMRSASAFAAALRAFAIALLCAALIVAWMRWIGREFIGAGSMVALPVVIAFVTACVTFIFARPTALTVASTLDSLANTSDHVSTWLFLRQLDAATLTATQRNFRDAQRASTLRVADSIHLKKHIAPVWPEWSRAIWIAMILLLSAILMPARHRDEIPAIDHAPGIGLSASPGGPAQAASPTLRELPRVQVLAPAQMRKLELMATDPQLPDALKRDALKELNDAIGGIAESELTPDVRQLLDMLRKDTAAASVDKKSDGSIQFSSKQEAAKSNAAAATPADYAPFQNVEQAWASSASEFDDVRDRLAKYYSQTK